MKIRKVKYNNHHVLGNLEMDFLNPRTNEPYNTVILIGENGTGKTTVLSTLSDFFNSVSLQPFQYIEYEADGHLYHIEPINNGVAGFHTRCEIGSNAMESISRSKNINAYQMYADKKDLRSYPSVFSKARADYKVTKISGISTTLLDTEIHEQDNKDDYTSLKQLIVDIYDQDSRDYMNQNKGAQMLWDVFYSTSRIFRFANAFNHFFDKVKFDRIETVNQDNLILFKKNGKDVPIDNLSTGEKQIVYRGAFLLKNSGIIDDGAVFIDEPELSMHPAWQRRILNYFQNLYKNPDGKLRAQLFFASHSEYVVASALEHYNDNLVVVLNENDGVINSRSITMPLVLPSITASEINYAAFGIPSVDYHIALYGAIQSKFGVHSISDCDSKIESCAPYYNADQHEAITASPSGTIYKTVCTKVRNHIDHPDTAPAYTEEEMQKSIILMRDICMNL